MAANTFVGLPSSELSCFKNGASKTVLQLLAPSTMYVKILGWSIAFDGINVTSEPVYVEFARQLSAGAMSAGLTTKLTHVSELVQSSLFTDATEEPTKGSVIDVFNIHPQAGIDVRYPEGECFLVEPNERVGIIVTTTNDINCTVKFICEE